MVAGKYLQIPVRLPTAEWMFITYRDGSAIEKMRLFFPPIQQYRRQRQCYVTQPTFGALETEIRDDLVLMECHCLFFIWTNGWC